MGHSTSSGRTGGSPTLNADRNEREESIPGIREWARRQQANRQERERQEAERAEFQRDRERQERIIRANNRILGRNMPDEEVSRRAERGARINATNRRRRGR